MLVRNVSAETYFRNCLKLVQLNHCENAPSGMLDPCMPEQAAGQMARADRDRTFFWCLSDLRTALLQRRLEF